MAGGAAGTPTQMGSASPAAPSQASQYSNYGAQPNGAFYAGPMSGAPASGGSYAQPSMPTYQSQPAQQGFGQGYGSPFGGMSGFPGQGYGAQFGGMGGFPGQGYGYGYGYQQQPQYGYGGMGNQFMGGGMYAPHGGFGGMMGQMYGGERGYGHGGFDPRYMDVKPNPEVVQQSTTQPTNEQASTPPQRLAELQRMMPPRWMNRRRGPYFGPEY